MEIRIGCSGFYYNHWKGAFYPDTLAKSKWLNYYAEHFNTVEINSSFYRLPLEKSVKNWYSVTPENFVFTMKGFRFITHMKKMIVDEDLKDSLTKFQHLSSLLKNKAGPILWQLPGSFRLNVKRLDEFCSVLSTHFLHIFEFRHISWFTDEVYDVLEKRKCGLCIVSGPGRVPEIFKSISGIAYIRFHGKGALYNDDYAEDDLQAYRKNLESTKPKKLYAYFNNDAHAFAIKNGIYFKSIF